MTQRLTQQLRKPWVLGVAVAAIAVAAVVAGRVFQPKERELRHAVGYVKKLRPHFDHAAVVTGRFDTPQDVTRRCLSCHPGARGVMKTVHWLWLGDEVQVPGHAGKARIGKRNVINNFCIATRGNERSCMKCHAGYGWTDASFDFSREENVDCLVCHEHTNNYVKGEYGLPVPGTDLVAAAKSVGTPTRENCLGCHAYGGGGQAVKHGDLDSSLAHPFDEEDVHIGRHGFLCVDCHGGKDHQIRGRAFSVSVEDAHGVHCTDCHTTPEHEDQRINDHLAAVACQACHIPTFAGQLPTKAFWDWSKAGDPKRKEDPHHYLKIKGEFTYEQDATPEYRWFNGTVGRYLIGDRMDPSKETVLNPPLGDVKDRGARIWPYKVHRAKQPFDAGYDILLTPITGGNIHQVGYWTNFDWDEAFRLGAKEQGIPYSGRYGFAHTSMYWPLSHMVTPRERALGCTDCHGAAGRMDWKALGYGGDPMKTGGRR